GRSRAGSLPARQAHGRHVHTLRPAEAALRLVASAPDGVTGLREADPKLAEPISRPGAHNGHHARVELWIGRRKCRDDITGTDELRMSRIAKAFGHADALK